MADLPFAKGQALGNDYLVLAAADLPWTLTPERVRVLCDRHHGVGSDGVLLAILGDDRFQLRIYNPDGSEAEKSGNGLRIFAAYLHDRGLVGEEPFQVELPGDTVTMQILREEGEGAVLVRAAMGVPSFQAEAIGFLAAKGVVSEVELDLGDGLSATVHPVSMGNPHCVVRVDDLVRDDFLRRAPRLSTHSAFRAGTNVQFARVTGPGSLQAWIYERGAGETLASGSSACAVAAVAHRNGWISESEVVIEMPGGNAVVSLDDDGMVRLEGPAQIVYHGVIRSEVAASW